jgi:hydroxymethylglutaryl-CoA reductase
MMADKTGDIKFYELSVDQRLKLLVEETGLSIDDLARLSGHTGLDVTQADHMIENVVGTYALPLGIARNFLINGREIQVPMVIEEPSVVAAASFMARLARAGGGFIASTDSPEMIGQMQVLDVADLGTAKKALEAERETLLAAADQSDPVLKKLGGGARDLQVRLIHDSPIGSFLVLHLIMDVRDAMGANAINTALERLSPLVEHISCGRVLLRILSNLADMRLARASCSIPFDVLATTEHSG